MDTPTPPAQMEWPRQKFEVTNKIKHNLKAFVALATTNPAWLVNPANDIEQCMMVEYCEDVVKTLHVFVRLLNEELQSHGGFEPLPVSQPDPLHLALLLSDVGTAVDEIMVELNAFSMYLLHRDPTPGQARTKQTVMEAFERVHLESTQAVMAMTKWDDLALRRVWARIRILYAGFDIIRI